MYSIYQQAAAKAAQAGQQEVSLREQRPFRYLVESFECQAFMAVYLVHLLCPHLPAEALTAET